MTAGRRRTAVMQRSGGVVQRRHRPDYVLIIVTALLLVIGLVVIYSISPGLAAQRGVGENFYVNKQLIAIGLGIITFLAMATIPYTTWRKFQKPLLIGAVIATLIALALPVSEQYPAHRWIRFGGLSFQSVEMVKFVAIFAFAAFLTERIKRREVNDLHKSVKPIGIWLLAAGVVIAGLQSDLGSTAVLVAMIIAMWYVAGLPLRRVLLIGAAVLIVLSIAISTSAYRRDRVMTFINPQQDCQAAGYQACQALIAVGSGGLFGKGIGHSVQAYGYLPEAANDSIFAIYAEKFGFFGVAILIGIFWTLFTRLKNIIERAPDDFARLVVVGVLTWFSVQAVINIGAMIGLLPLKGITLPFISYGGTSIIFVTAAIGLVFNISRYTTLGINDTTDYSPKAPNQQRRYALGYSSRR